MAQPLFLNPVMQEKIWGGRRLQEVYGYPLPSDHTGECWAISAHPNGVTTIANGRYEGLGLDKLYSQRPDLFGHPKSPVFPLLTKILDANEWLSVQVHPDDTYALSHEGELGKTECWYVLDAEPGAEIIYGHQAQSRQQLSQMIEQGQWDALLTRVPVKKGDFFYVPAGTIHAIGKGILILETQQSSDTTYRLYDFDRLDDQGQKRPLHLQDSIAVTKLGKPENSHPATLSIGDLLVTHLVSNDFFTVYAWDLDGQASFKRTAPYLLVSILEGSGDLVVDDRHYPLNKGQHLILPNDVTTWTLSGKLSLIVSHPNEDLIEKPSV